MKRPLLYGILFLKCLPCRQRKFVEGNPYNLLNFNKVNDSCPKCTLKFSIEPAFYIRAMYVSYAVGVGVAAYCLGLLFGSNFGPRGILASIMAALILTMPYIGTVSKFIWPHFFFKYNSEIAKKVSNDSRT